jgi:hypothetical protein
MHDATDAELVPLKKELERFGRRQPACQALAQAHYGIGPLTAVFVWAELGDCRRFSRSMQVVRHTGLDVAVDSSDRHRAGGYLCRQGPPTLRWALFDAGKAAARATSPDYDYYQAVKKAHDGKLATIAMARKLARRCNPAGPRPRGGLRHAHRLKLTNPVGIDGADRLSQTSGSLRSAPATRMPASSNAGRPYNTEATALPTGGHPNTTVVADDIWFVAFLGNAGRPHAADIAGQPSTRHRVVLVHWGPVARQSKFWQRTPLTRGTKQETRAPSARSFSAMS